MDTDIMAKILEKQNELLERLVKVEEQLSKSSDETSEKIDKLVGGFPRGRDGEPDPDGHRRYHEEMIEYMKSQREFWADIRKKTIIGIMWAGLVFVGNALLQHAVTIIRAMAK